MHIRSKIKASVLLRSWVADELCYKVCEFYESIIQYYASFCTAMSYPAFAGSRSAGPRAKGEIILVQKYMQSCIKQ